MMTRKDYPSAPTHTLDVVSMPASEPVSEPVPAATPSSAAPGYARPARLRRPTRAARTGASPYDPGETPLGRNRRALFRWRRRRKARGTTANPPLV